MKRPKKILSPVVTMILFAAAIAMLLGSSIGGTRAALTYYSETYTSRIQLFDIGVALKENGEKVAERTYSTANDGTWTGTVKGELLKDMLKKEDGEGTEPLRLGKAYEEELRVANTGTINEYVRVTLYKYWVDEKGNKLTQTTDPERALSPEMIRLRLDNVHIAVPNPAWQEERDYLTGTGEWLEDAKARTEERTVLYYNKVLHCKQETGGNTEDGEETPLFADTLTIDGAIARKVNQTTTKEDKDGVTYTTITTTYDYDGAKFLIEAQVDAVQEHNAEDAIKSAWGRDVTITNGVLSLN